MNNELLSKSALVRVLVRTTTNRSPLESLGVTDFVVGDLLDKPSVLKALTAVPKSDGLVTCAAGYTGHTRGDSASFPFWSAIRLSPWLTSTTKC